MRTLTLKTAIEIGFEYENSDFETREELEAQIMDYLLKNTDKLRKEEDECKVQGKGIRQYVNYDDFSSSGEIITWDAYLWNKPADHKIFHSSFLVIDKKTGEPYEMNLFEYVGKNETNSLNP